jgi:hypothetical protein
MPVLRAFIIRAYMGNSRRNSGRGRFIAFSCGSSISLPDSAITTAGLCRRRVITHFFLLPQPVGRLRSAMISVVAQCCRLYVENALDEL